MRVNFPEIIAHVKKYQWQQQTCFTQLSYFLVDTVYRVFSLFSTVFSLITCGLCSCFQEKNSLTGEREFSLISRRCEASLGEIIWCYISRRYRASLAYVDMSLPCAQLGSEQKQRDFVQKADTTSKQPCLQSSQKQRMSFVINRIVNRLCCAQNRSILRSDQYNYQCSVVKSFIENAATLPGGYMHITDQLLKNIAEAKKNGELNSATVIFHKQVVRVDLRAVPLEDIFATIIAHEMGHVAARHTIISRVLNIISLIFLDIIVMLLFGGCFSSADIDKLVYLMGRFLYLNRSKRQEYEADIAGLILQTQAKYNPLASLAVQQYFALGKMNPDFPLEFLSTHPTSENRKSALLCALDLLEQRKVIPKIKYLPVTAAEAVSNTL